VAWGHAVPAVVIDAAGQERFRFHPFGLVVGDLLVEPRLDAIEQSLIQNDGLLAFEDFALERDFADIEAIAQKLRQRAPGKRYAADMCRKLKTGTRSHPGRFPLVASARHVMPPEQISGIKLPCDLPLALTASGPVGR
jgi:hypothetical protein